MKSNKSNLTLINSVSSVLLQIVTIISGFVIPRLTLSTFGSDVNGLVSSLNQFLNYVSLLEGGITGVIMANLYKPLYNKDSKKISSVISATKIFYRKIAYFFVAYSIILSIVYPLVFKTRFSFEYVFFLSVILSVSLFIQYNFSLSLKVLLNADKKVYIVSFTQIFLSIVNMVLFSILIRVFPNIHFLKIVTSLVYIFQPIIYKKFVDKHFMIDCDEKPDSNLLKSRWDGFAINVAAFLHRNTDVSILTIFTNLKTVSVYSVYALVASGLRSLITSASSGVAPTIGHLYAKNNIIELNEKFDTYEFIIFITTFFLFGVGILMITPFVMIYTKGITDANYNQEVFGVLLLIAEAIYCIREPYVTLAYSANKFREIKKHAYIEAIINILLSVILVKKVGLIGVAIGTLMAMLYRTLFHIVYLKRNILYRPISVSLRKISIFLITTLFGIILCRVIIPIHNYSLLIWILYSIIYSVIIGILLLLMSFIYFKEEFKLFYNLFNKIKKVVKK